MLVNHIEGHTEEQEWVLILGMEAGMLSIMAKEEYDHKTLNYYSIIKRDYCCLTFKEVSH